MNEQLIFEYDSAGRQGFVAANEGATDIPAEFLRENPPLMPRASEHDEVQPAGL